MDFKFILLLIMTSSVMFFDQVQSQENNKNYSPVRYKGRRMCTIYKEVNKPIKVSEPYVKPVYQKFTRKCEDNPEFMCDGAKMIYETAYRDVYKTNIVKVPVQVCCPGWQMENNFSSHCSERVCSQVCFNGGSCVSTDKCTCLQGFTGDRCEIDVDECLIGKPCDHFCVNTRGSFYCTCKNTYILQEDKRSCKEKTWCPRACLNGGTCVGFDRCACLPGFSGSNCDDDIDECTLERPCDHVCFNTKGSYYCTCKSNFTLHDDKQSCKVNDVDLNNTAFEAEDLDNQDLAKRVLNLEKMMGLDDTLDASQEISMIDMKNKLDDAIDDIVRLEGKVKNLEYRLPRIHRFRSRHRPARTHEPQESKKRN